jgi:hypothetical protein
MFDGIKKKEYLGGFTIIAISLTRIYALKELRCPARGILQCAPVDAIVLAGKTPLSGSFPIFRRLWCLLRREFHTVVHRQCNNRAQYCDSNDQQDKFFHRIGWFCISHTIYPYCFYWLINSNISFIFRKCVAGTG